MRRPGASSFALALLLGFTVFGIARASEDDMEADDDADLDLEDLEDDVAGAPGGGEVDDFDLGMPVEDQKKRMMACYVHMVNRIQHRRDQLDVMVQEFVQQRSGEVSEDQAANSIVLSWMMQCYMNIDSSGMKEAIRGKAASDELENQLFAPKSSGQKQASQRQWALLTEVVEGIQKEQMQQQQGQQQQQQKSTSGRASEPPPQQPQQPQYAGGGPLFSNLSGQSQAIYVLVVFGVIFGLIVLGVMRLMRSESENRNRLSKKKEKSDKKASRKKQ